MDREKIYNELVVTGYQCYKKLQYLQAKERFELALKVNPKGILATLGVAETLSQLRRYSEALEYLQGIDDKSKYPKVYHEIGVIKFCTLHLDEAVQYLYKAYELSLAHLSIDRGVENSASYYESYINIQKHASNIKEMQLLGINPFDDKPCKTSEIIKCFSHKKEEFAETLLLLGLNSFRNNQYKLAERLYLTSLNLSPSPQCYNQLAALYFNLKDLKKLKFYIHKALEGLREDLDLADASHALLRLKEFDLGWSCYERRNDKEMIHEVISLKEFRKEWDLEATSTKTVNFMCELGHGDSIQFARFIKDYQSNDKIKFHLIVYKNQKALFEHNFPEIKVYTYSELKRFKDLSKMEFFFLGSFLQKLKLTDKNIPYKEGYLEAPPLNRAKIKPFIKDNKKLKVGFCWQVNSGVPESYNVRKVPLEYFLKLAEMEGIELYSLQHGFEERPLRSYARKLNITLLGRQIKDFADTFAAASYMDLVISPDTSLLHVAGSQGIPNWALLPKGADWRWFDYEEQNPWYDSGRLFHQKKVSDWEGVFEDLTENLKEALLFKSRDRLVAI